MGSLLAIFPTLLFSALAVGFGRFLFGRWTRSLDPFAEVGICGLLGLGSVGLLTLFIGLLPSGLNWGVWLMWALVVGGSAASFARSRPGPFLGKKPEGNRLFLVAGLVICLVLCIVIGGIAVLTPSTMTDWDTLAYHLAVPKLWLQAGHIYPITFIHHSNFPLSVDNLYIWGLKWGDQSGAKAFELCIFVLGLLAVFGTARRRYGGIAAVWGVLAFATVPVVLWEAGTGYIDVAHGLFTGLGVVFAIEGMAAWAGRDRERAGEFSAGASFTNSGAPFSTPTRWIADPKDLRDRTVLAGLCLGFSVGTKYTGLQSLIALGVVLGMYALLSHNRPGFLRLCAAAGLALAIGGVWYVKNVAWVGNPVYPFFYKMFGGKNWSQYNADIYSVQQQTFGIPRDGAISGLAAFPFAVLGLSFQPGRYTDPNPALVVENGHASGASGTPLQATGGVLLAAGLVWLLSGKARSFEGPALGWIGFSLLMWFFLSQQSRYALDFAPILAILAGGAAVRTRAGPVLAAAVALQSVFTLYLFYEGQLSDQMLLVNGETDLVHYMAQREPFFLVAGYLNNNDIGKVALYDEVHGFYLDIPYFWANPGHTTEIGYEKLNDGGQFADRLQEMGFKQVYVNLMFDPKADRERRRAALDGSKPYTRDEKAVLVGDQGQKYKWLLADAVARHRLAVAKDFGFGIVFSLDQVHSHNAPSRS